ncbi:hypothetical protein EDD29_6523 [Actinocorallia herbida]|uniref:DUF4352 domain-containing protein n=1 Tax=Actinocorallia herbida TaxID=58109 RepID=A0A3N1D5L7_9ACTN|nr:DUF4352 domain-containing protein [Actinocorallia herbida]ROO88841.1 hypothetical protein EDD29_6523 [Actinocorallia herbida]
MRRSPTLALLAAAVASAACSGPAPTKPSPAFYDITPAPARSGETVLRGVSGTSGDEHFQLLGYTAGMPATPGSHIEVPAVNGQYVRLHLLVTNTARTSATLPLAAQRVETSDGTAYSPDLPTMSLKRQPLTPDLYAQSRLEFDLWYDIPAAAVPVKAVLQGTTPYSTTPPPAVHLALPPA